MSQAYRQLLKRLEEGEEAQQILLDTTAYTDLAALSEIGQNLLSWYRFDPEASLLEIGSGCGVLTKLFAASVAEVYAVEPDEDKRKIAQYVLQGFENALCSDMFPAEGVSFDYVVIPDFSGSTQDLLEQAASYLKPDGVLILAADNKYAHRYLGQRRDQDRKLLHLLQIRRMLAQQDLIEGALYFPYPDKQLPMQIFSADRLPKTGEVRRTPDYRHTSYDVVSESSLIEDLVEDGLYAFGANSYLLFASREEVTERMPKMQYVKCNSERDLPYRISTIIEKNASDILQVRKHPQTKEAANHLEEMLNCRSHLEDAYTKVSYLKAQKDGRDLIFPYAQGSSLLEGVTFTGSAEDAAAKLSEALAPVFEVSESNRMPFYSTPEFEACFPGIEISDEEAICPGNLDAIASNFIRTEDNIVCFDYEWVCDFPVPAEYLKFRSYYYYYIETEALHGIAQDVYLRAFGYDEQQIRTYLAMEEGFQQKVHGENRKYKYLPRFEKKCISATDIDWLEEAVEHLQKAVKEQQAVLELQQEKFHHPLRYIVNKHGRKEDK